MIMLLAIFFTPVTAYPDNPYLAHAFFVSLYEGILLGDRPSFHGCANSRFTISTFYKCFFPIFGVEKGLVLIKKI